MKYPFFLLGAMCQIDLAMTVRARPVGRADGS